MRTLIILCLLFSAIAQAHSKENILIIGDSLSAGYGIQVKDSWPNLLQARLEHDGRALHVHNASISGQTSSEGVRQIDQLLQLTEPKLVILELGANDGLRGLSIAQMQKNLQVMIDKSLASKAKVLLVGIKVPDNYGRRYGQMFEASFSNLAKENAITLAPFLLEPLSKIITQENRAQYIQADGLHPTAKAQPLLLEYLMPYIHAQL